MPAAESDCDPISLSLDFSTSMITDSELVLLASSHLEKINLRDCLLVSDAGIAAVLSKCTRLEELNLKGITDLTDLAFEIEGTLPRLRSLNISDAPISDQGLKKLVSTCPNLSVLSLQAKNLTDQGIHAMATCCRHLVRLKILQAEQVSEEALLGVLKNNPHLGHLVVQGCNLTDRFLEALAHHPL